MLLVRALCLQVSGELEERVVQIERASCGGPFLSLFIARLGLQSSVEARLELPLNCGYHRRSFGTLSLNPQQQKIFEANFLIFPFNCLCTGKYKPRKWFTHSPSTFTPMTSPTPLSASRPSSSKLLECTARTRKQWIGSLCKMFMILEHSQL